MANGKVLSSGWTVFSKYVFPAVWLTAFGSASVLMALGKMKDQNGNPPPGALRVAFPVLWVLGLAWWKLFLSKLVRVEILDRTLRISDGWREAEVPLGQVQSVSASQYIRGNPITIRFTQATPRGSEVIFLPGGRLTELLKGSIFKELEDAVSRAKEDPRENQ